MSYYTTTYSGKRLSFTNPQSDQICLDDIFQALPQLCRFSGNTKYFYSVAQHSLNCYYVAKNFYQANIETQLACLLHDAAETYISDIPTDLKKLAREVRITEDTIMVVLWRKIFDEYCSKFKNNTEENLVDLIDKKLAVTEFDKLIGQDRSEWILTQEKVLPINNNKIPEVDFSERKIDSVRDEFSRTVIMLIDKLKKKYGSEIQKNS